MINLISPQPITNGTKTNINNYILQYMISFVTLTQIFIIVSLWDIFIEPCYPVSNRIEHLTVQM